MEREIVVGRVVSVSEHAGARAPSYLLEVDLGPHGRHTCSIPRGDRKPSDLEGTQVVCTRDGDDLLVLAAHSHTRGPVLLRPERDVEDGTIVA